MVKIQRIYTDSSQFDNGKLLFGKALATSLQWLYDEDEFPDEKDWPYCMDGVLPICDFMTMVAGFISMAFQDFGEPNIKNCINLIEKDHSYSMFSKPELQYVGGEMILGKVRHFTTEVILWAAYLYCHIRKDIDRNNENVERADKLLYKLYVQETGLKREYVKDTFLMKHFNQTALNFIKNISNSPEIKETEENENINTQSNNEMGTSVLNKISPNNIRYYYEGWRNGKHGSICQTNGIYRFVEQAYGKSGILDAVNKNEKDNPIVAIGIVAYWLQFNSRMDTVIKRLTKYNCEKPKDIREQFDNYTQIRFIQFRQEHRDDPDTWNWDWEFEFYTKYIIPHEMKLNKISGALFDYITDDDIKLVQSVMRNYIKYLKTVREERGYHVNPELLVLRAIESGDETKQEDLEEFVVNTILDKLEDKGYIKVAWIEGHKSEGVRLLDKGWCYLKQLEAAKQDVSKPANNKVKTEPNSRNKPKPKAPKNTNAFTKSTFTCKGLNEDQFKVQRLALFCDGLFGNFVATKEVEKSIEKEKLEKLFTGKPLKKDERITWMGAKKELVYFFRQFKDYLEKPSTESYWDIVASHFIIETQGKKKVRKVAISADSLQSTTEKPQKGMMKKLDDIIMTLTAPIAEVFQLHSNNAKEDAEATRNKDLADKALIKELLDNKGNNRK